MTGSDAMETVEWANEMTLVSNSKSFHARAHGTNVSTEAMSIGNLKVSVHHNNDKFSWSLASPTTILKMSALNPDAEVFVPKQISLPQSIENNFTMQNQPESSKMEVSPVSGSKTINDIVLNGLKEFSPENVTESVANSSDADDFVDTKTDLDVSQSTDEMEDDFVTLSVNDQSEMQLFEEDSDSDGEVIFSVDQFDSNESDSDGEVIFSVDQFDSNESDGDDDRVIFSRDQFDSDGSDSDCGVIFSAEKSDSDESDSEAFVTAEQLDSDTELDNFDGDTLCQIILGLNKLQDSGTLVPNGDSSLSNEYENLESGFINTEFLMDLSYIENDIGESIDSRTTETQQLIPNPRIALANERWNFLSNKCEDLTSPVVHFCERVEIIEYEKEPFDHEYLAMRLDQARAHNERQRNLRSKKI